MSSSSDDSMGSYSPGSGSVRLLDDGVRLPSSKCGVPQRPPCEELLICQQCSSVPYLRIGIPASAPAAYACESTSVPRIPSFPHFDSSHSAASKCCRGIAVPSSQGVPCPKSSARGAPSVEHGVPEICSALIHCLAPSALIGSGNLRISPQSAKGPRLPCARCKA